MSDKEDKVKKRQSEKLTVALNGKKLQVQHLNQLSTHCFEHQLHLRESCEEEK